MAASTPSTIVLSDQPFVQEEMEAASVVLTPGDLVKLASATTVTLHSTAGGNARALFVLENPYIANDTATKNIDTPYGLTDTVRYIIGKPGDKVYGWLTVGASVPVGTYLESAGSLGALRAVAGTTNPARIVGVAAETVNNTAGGARARIKVEVV